MRCTAGCLSGGRAYGYAEKRYSEGKEEGEAEIKSSEALNDLYLAAHEPMSSEYARNREVISSECVQNRELISLEHVLSKEREPELSAPVRRGAALEEESCGNTVFFDSAKLAEHKLYALDKKNKKHIELTKFPFTVGKMAGCVDCILADESVSRIHARFERAGDVIQLTDMNSTNGTYRNGLRMQPQETVEIEPGDEIRFGKLNYCYR